jgi:hypothetical protein
MGVSILAFITWLIACKKGLTDNICKYIKSVFNDMKQYYSKYKAAYILTLLTSIAIFVFFFVLFISLCFFNNSTPISGIVIDIIGQLLMALVFIFVIFLLYKGLLSIWNVRYFKNIPFLIKLSIIFMFLFIVQVFLVLNLRIPVGGDVGAVINPAAHALYEAPIQSNYLSKWQNNLMLFFIIHHFKRFLLLINFTRMSFGLLLLNILLVDISLFISIITVKKIYPSSKRVILLFILFSLLVGLSPWLIIPYSDTFLMPIVSLFVLLCLMIVKSTNIAKQVVLTCVCGLLFALGWLIKPTMIAVIAALFVIGIIYLVQKNKEVSLRQTGVLLLSGSLVFVLSMGLFNLYTEKQNIIDLDKAARTPASYTIATGLVERPIDMTRNVYGAWNFDVHNINHGTTEEKNENFYIFIKEKLSELGAVNYSLFLFNKARWMTSEGYFFWMREGGFVRFPNPEGGLLKDIFYTNGEYFSIYLHTINGIWIIVFLGLCIGMFASCFTGFGNNKMKNSFDLFLRLIVFFSVFVLLFTEGRSRYLLSFLPVFCIISVNGLSYIEKIIKNNKCNNIGE